MRVCNNCRRNTSESKRFCPYCGYDVDGWEKNLPRFFCDECGFRLNEEGECPYCISIGENKDKFNLKNAEFIEKMQAHPIGSLVEFGSYRHGNDEEKTPIVWRMLNYRNGRCLLISEYGIDVKQYASSELFYTWEDSGVRRWLNVEFMNVAFDSWEQSRLVGRTLCSGNNPEYEDVVDNGKLTRDFVALLSLSDISVYRGKFDLRCKARYGDVDRFYSENGYCSWWLRTPGDALNKACYVNADGEISYEGTQHTGMLYVRPVICLKVEEDSLL